MDKTFFVSFQIIATDSLSDSMVIKPLSVWIHTESPITAQAIAEAYSTAKLHFIKIHPEFRKDSIAVCMLNVQELDRLYSHEEIDQISSML